MAPTNTPTPVPTPAAATLSLDEYLTYCAPSEQELADDATYGDVSVLAAELIQRLEAMVPPADLVEWHQLHIEFFRTVQAIFDRFPKDDVIDDAKMDEFLLAVAPDLEEKYGGLEEKLSEVAVRLPEHLRQQMIEVDCLNPDIVPDEYDDPDDHGNNFESATRIAIGEAVAIELEFRLDKDVLVFLAELGTEYEFTLDWESYSRLRNTARPILALFDAGGQELVRLNHYVFGSQDKMMWQAVTRGDYYIVVGDTVTHGSITLTVTDGEATEQLGRDDHGDDIDDATVAAVGADVEGVIDYPGDYDYFRFAAEESQIYQIDVALGSLPDSVLVLLGPDGWELAYNDDHGDSWASRVVWLAPESGVYYLVVESSGFDADVGTYTLTVSHSTIVDDHGDDIDDATAIRVGADVRGAVDYDDDIDFFRFQAEQGESYQIDVALGTLDDSIVDLYDADGSYLDSNDDYGDTFASRLYWEAPSSGERYVTVEGYGIGTYTLTVSIIDDHGDTAEDGGSVAPDRAALVALYNATEGGSWTTRTNWLSGRPLDEWHGVTTDSDGRVTALNLSSNQLGGALPAELGDLTNLRALNLGSNQLTGPIPAELGDLANLSELNLDSNQLTGRIPAELGDLANLSELNLDSNQLTGRIPAELGDLANLESLRLGWNELTGRIPAWLGDLANLRALNLGSNQLTGPIPAELGDLSNLELLVLSGNQLTGPIPAELGDLANLESLRLGWNELTGRIPAWLGDLTNLKWLWLGSNQLTGPIPAELGDLANLEFLYLSDNQLTGPIPAELGDLTNLVELELWGNQLTGRIPAELGSLSNLSELYLSGNQLTGPIPAELGDLANLESLDLSNNELTGPIPAWLGDLANLESLDLSNNELTGPIPAWLGDLSNLVELYLSGNQLTGCVPVGLRDVAEWNDLGELELPDCG